MSIPRAGSSVRYTLGPYGMHRLGTVVDPDYSKTTMTVRAASDERLYEVQKEHVHLITRRLTL